MNQFKSFHEANSKHTNAKKTNSTVKHRKNKKVKTKNQQNKYLKKCLTTGKRSKTQNAARTVNTKLKMEVLQATRGSRSTHHMGPNLSKHVMS